MILSPPGLRSSAPVYVYFEAFWVFSTFGYVLSNYTLVRDVPVFQKRFRFSRNIVLLVHLALALAEVVRYHTRAVFWSPKPVLPTAIDAAISLAHSISVFRLARDRKVGDTILTRPTHQSLATIRIVLCLMAFSSGSIESRAFYYRATVRIMNAFLYPRLMIRVGCLLKALPNYKSVYAAAMFLSCLLCMHDTNLRFGPQIFFGLFLGNLILNRWVSGMIIKSEARDGEKCNPVVGFLYQEGFAELKALRDGRALHSLAQKLLTSQSMTSDRSPQHTLETITEMKIKTVYDDGLVEQLSLERI
ncbi:hypothetical protein F4780DRAFT_681218 [Xylariomycetidae sp. FL0641]|nr:hypothetical protein F4780DRAFT_681218 [Xylariomycetidae sp. FL0641]